MPVKGMVTLIDLGADQCVPCKMMAPILTKLQKDYKDKAAIVVIDVYKNNDQVQRFGIRAIPTQIFYDPNGNGSLPPRRLHERKGDCRTANQDGSKMN